MYKRGDVTGLVATRNSTSARIRAQTPCTRSLFDEQDRKAPEPFSHDAAHPSLRSWYRCCLTATRAKIPINAALSGRFRGAAETRRSPAPDTESHERGSYLPEVRNVNTGGRRALRRRYADCQGKTHDCPRLTPVDNSSPLYQRVRSALRPANAASGNADQHCTDSRLRRRAVSRRSPMRTCSSPRRARVQCCFASRSFRTPISTRVE